MRGVEIETSDIGYMRTMGRYGEGSAQCEPAESAEAYRVRLPSVKSSTAQERRTPHRADVSSQYTDYASTGMQRHSWRAKQVLTIRARRAGSSFERTSPSMLRSETLRMV